MTEFIQSSSRSILQDRLRIYRTNNLNDQYLDLQSNHYTKKNNIKFISGTMFAGKTYMISHHLRMLSRKNIQSVVFVPNLCISNNHTYKSRANLQELNIKSIDNTFSFREYLQTHKLQHLIIDEAQFLTQKQIEELANQLHVNIYAYGIVNDFQNQVFPGVKVLLQYTPITHIFDTICHFCNNNALFNQRLDTNGNPITSGSQICVSTTQYRVVCENHFVTNTPLSKRSYYTNNLHVYLGPIDSINSDKLFLHYNYVKHTKPNVLLRIFQYNNNIIKSSINQQLDTMQFDENFDFLQNIKNNNLSLLFISDGHYLTINQIKQLKRIVCEFDIRVHIYGIETDFMGCKFANNDILKLYADYLSKIDGICYCGEPAIMDQRINEHKKPITQMHEMSNNDSYVSVCEKCFIKPDRNTREY